MPLAIDFFASIIAMWTPSLDGFDRLTVDDSRARSGFSPSLNATAFAQHGHDLFPDPFIAKERKVVIHGFCAVDSLVAASATRNRLSKDKKSH